jgi:hypothetical protein
LQSRFQSEDDASFDALAVKMREAHRRRYWWVYEHPSIEAGREKLYLLPSGEFMTEEQRTKRDEVRLSGGRGACLQIGRMGQRSKVESFDWVTS